MNVKYTERKRWMLGRGGVPLDSVRERHGWGEAVRTLRK